MVTIREAATVMLLRDQPDLHVFMLRRNLDAAFVGGAYVFPGGAVDEEDRAPELAARCHGHTDAQASARIGVPDGGLGYWVAAIREAFEESGVLLTRDASTGAPVDVLEGGRAARLDAARAALVAGERTFLEVVTDEDLLLDDGALHYFAHWITPAGAPRRFDTRFFVAEAPEGHAYLHDDAETVASLWIRPQEALDRNERGEWELILPTMRSLQTLSGFETTADALEAVHLRHAATEASGSERRELASERAPAGRVSRPAASEREKGAVA